jgi:hypothetical protein
MEVSRSQGAFHLDNNRVIYIPDELVKAEEGHVRAQLDACAQKIFVEVSSKDFYGVDDVDSTLQNDVTCMPACWIVIVRASETIAKVTKAAVTKQNIFIVEPPALKVPFSISKNGHMSVFIFYFMGTDQRASRVNSKSDGL